MTVVLLYENVYDNLLILKEVYLKVLKGREKAGKVEEKERSEMGDEGGELLTQTVPQNLYVVENFF